jgi:hypothetical protein
VVEDAFRPPHFSLIVQGAAENMPHEEGACASVRRNETDAVYPGQLIVRWDRLVGFECYGAVWIPASVGDVDL